MDIFVIILRVIHIFASVFWAGAAAMIFFFLEPTAATAVPEGPKFLGRLVLQKRMNKWIIFAATLNPLAGILLYWQDSAFQLSWTTTRTGLGFTAGALAGIAASFLGWLVISPTIERRAALGQEIETGGKPPTPQQAAEMQRLQQRTAMAGKLDIALLTIALLMMATARYL
jgi:uncharacterized membrane protein